MVGLPFWDAESAEESEAWDTCSLGGTMLPGVATVDCPTERGLDAKKSKGTDGATFSDSGRELTEVTISLQIHTREHWELWQAIRPTIEPQKLGGSKMPLAIEHPKAALAGVSSVYIKQIAEGTPSSSAGMTITIKAIEWAPEPKPTKATTSKAKAAPAAPAAVPYSSLEWPTERSEPEPPQVDTNGFSTMSFD